jgi:hypothetical protein
MMGLVSYFRGRGCQATITGAVREVPLPDIDDAVAPFQLASEDDTEMPGCPPRMAPGTFATAEPAEAQNGGFVLALADVTGTRYTDDRTRMSGCCGPSGIDGPNLLCAACGAEVGTESSDCWTVHEVVLEPAAVEPVRS